MSYNRKEVLNATLKYFNGDELAANVWINKYALKDSYGNIYEKTPNDMHYRLANELHRIESKYPNPMAMEEIFDMLKGFKYVIPQGGSMAGIGNKKQIVSLSNCFVIGPVNGEDSYGSIMKVDEEQVQLMKRRGGVGHDLSHIRPKNSPVHNSALTSTGIVPFMERYSSSTREVGQDGRRGALMLSLDIRHPNVDDFIDAKLDISKITGANISVKISDEFMESVKNNKPFILRYPINSKLPANVEDLKFNELFKLNSNYYKKIDSVKLFEKLVDNSWKSAEPGILFWDKIIDESPADCYIDEGFKTKSTNPCIVGDTKVCVADGRDSISIKELAKDGKDVPVYALNDDGELTIRKMRNPRITGYKEKIYKIIVEGGHELRVTGNHEFKLKNGGYVEAKNLKIGDGLHVMTKTHAGFNSKSQNYSWLTVNGKKESTLEHKLISEYYNDLKIENGYVVHHKDYNGLNNNPNNLIIMGKKDYDELHLKDRLGFKNSYYRMSDFWKFKFGSHSGMTNRAYIDVSNDEIINHAKKLTKSLNRKFNKREWIQYAKKNNLPQEFSNYRKKNIGDVTCLAKKVALDLKYEYVDLDARLVKTYKKALDDGYSAEIIDNDVIVRKKCENCGQEFNVSYFKREIGFCSHSCSLEYINSNVIIKEKRKESINDIHIKKSELNKTNQIKILSDLEFSLGRTPKLIEWKKECKKNKIPYRLRTKHGFKSYKEICEEADVYNHKVISIQEDGYEDVYNGTVDEFHNFFIGDFKENDKFGKDKFISFNNLQCGELPLPPYDSCRLLAINLFSYVENPFTKNASFNYELFKDHIIKAQRMMDDIVDLEIEKIDMILNKISKDPETDKTKMVEKDLWEKIKSMAKNGRRTGLGITGEGDMLAALNYTYGTSSATSFANNIHKLLAVNAYKSSSIMGQERGGFLIWDGELEKDSQFLNRLKDVDKELKTMLDKPRRNISLLTIAPTGSVSIMTQTTSGIEPAFLVSYKRNRKINPNDKDAKVSFVDDNGDVWEEYNVFHHHFKTWLEIQGYNINEVKKYSKADLYELIKKSPYYNATSDNVNWIEKVKMQGEIQKWIDHSISVTVNLPKETSKKVVRDVFINAWEYGCKGVTIYRDGSRSGVLIGNNNEANEILKETHAPKRPKKLKCNILRFQNNKEKWIGFIGLMENKPYEIFTGLLDSFPVPNFVENGWIEKNRINGESRYDLIYFDKDGYEQKMVGLSRAFKEEYWNYGKLISGVLRHGMPIVNTVSLVDGLSLTNNIVSWKSGVTRMLKKYIIKADSNDTCPMCGNKLTFSDGCLICKNTDEKEGCGWSKCG